MHFFPLSWLWQNWAKSLKKHSGTGSKWVEALVSESYGAEIKTSSEIWRNHNIESAKIRSLHCNQNLEWIDTSFLFTIKTCAFELLHTWNESIWNRTQVQNIYHKYAVLGIQLTYICYLSTVHDPLSRLKRAQKGNRWILITSYQSNSHMSKLLRSKMHCNSHKINIWLRQEMIL